MACLREYKNEILMKIIVMLLWFTVYLDTLGDRYTNYLFKIWNSRESVLILGSARSLPYLILFTFLSFLYCSRSLFISSTSFFNRSAKKPRQHFVYRNIISFPEKPTGEVVPSRVIPFTLYPPGTRYVSSVLSLIKLSHSWRVVFFKRISKSYSLKHAIFVPFYGLFL